MARRRLLVLYHKRLEEIQYSGAGKAIIDHYNTLARHLDVTVVSIVPPHKCRRPPGLWGVAFRYHVACSASAREVLLYSLRLASSLSRRLEPLLLAALLSLGIGPGAAMGEAVAGGYDAVVVEQPYLDTRSLPRESLAVRLHNIEAEYVEMLARLEDMELPEAVKRLIGASEGERLRRARGLVALSFRDALLAEKLYGVKACYAPPVITPAEPAAQWEPPAPPRSYVVYVASPHRPNIVAAKPLLAAAPLLEGLGLRVVIAGALGEHLQRRGLRPRNVTLLGRLSEEQLAALYRGAYAAYIPHMHRSGLPIKLLEAVLHGAPPLVERRLAALPPLQGLDETNAVIAERLAPAEMAEALRSTMHRYDELLRSLRRLASRYSRENLVRLNLQCLDAVLA